jgi:hypothetical protein
MDWTVCNRICYNGFRWYRKWWLPWEGLNNFRNIVNRSMWKNSLFINVKLISLLLIRIDNISSSFNFVLIVTWLISLPKQLFFNWFFCIRNVIFLINVTVKNVYIHIFLHLMRVNVIKLHVFFTKDCNNKISLILMLICI